MAKAPPAVAPAGPAPDHTNGHFHNSPAPVDGGAPPAGELHHLRDLLSVPVGRSGAAPRGSPAESPARSADQTQPESRQAVLRAVLALHEAARPARRLRPQL